MKTFCAVSIASLLRCQVALAFVTTPPPPFSGGTSPPAQCQQSSRHDPLRLPVLRGSFFDDLFGANKGNSNAEEKPATTDNIKEDSKATPDEMKEDIVNDDDVWDASGLAAEIERRSTGNNDEESNTGREELEDVEEEEAEFDGYALRDAILNKFGVCWDVDFQRVESYGFRKVYLNILPFKLGSRRFRHQSEWDYLCHLQAIVEILQKYDLLDSVLVQLEETKKKPRPGTSPLVAVPLRLDLTEEQIDQILGPRR